MGNKSRENLHAKQNAGAWLETIIELIHRLNGNNNSEYESKNSVREEIQESALEIQVRSDWHNPGENDAKPTEYYILLTTGGPACRIIGELDRHCQPDSAKLQWQDWGTPWTDLATGSNADDALLTFAQQFYFGE